MRYPLKTVLIGTLAYALGRLLLASWRVRFIGLSHRRDAAARHAHGSFCLGVWHEHFFACILAHRGQRFAPMASLSRDGDVASFVLERLGYRPVRGSSSRGGSSARDEMVELATAGYFTGLTVDGPRGPRRQLKSGAIDVSRRTGAAFLPFACRGDREWVLTKSWDQFKIPKPFSRVVLAYGDPMAVPRAISGDAFDLAKREAERRINAAEAAALAELESWRGKPLRSQV